MKVEDVIKEFDEKFELESEGCSECGGFELIDKTEIKYPKGKYHCEYDLEKVKNFLISTIISIYKEELKDLGDITQDEIDDNFIGGLIAMANQKMGINMERRHLRTKLESKIKEWELMGKGGMK